MDEPPRWISTAPSYYASNAFFPDDGYSSPRSSQELQRSEEEELEHQKFIMAMAQEQTRGESDYLKSKLWWLGISLMVLGEVGNFVGKHFPFSYKQKKSFFSILCRFSRPFHH